MLSKNKENKEKSMLQISIEIIKEAGQLSLTEIGNRVMAEKGIKTIQGKAEALPQFYCDFMESGCFVYLGNETWDLKENQTTSALDKDGYTKDGYNKDDNDKEAQKYELKSDEDNKDSSEDESDDTDEDNDKTDDDIDFESVSSNEEVSSDEDIDLNYQDDSEDQDDEEN